MYFFEAIEERINAMPERYSAMQRIARFQLKYALRASEIVDINATFTIEPNQILITGKKKGNTQIITNPRDIAEIKDFIDLWNDKLLMCSYSKYYRTINEYFDDFKKDRAKIESKTHLFRYAAAQRKYVQTKNIPEVSEILREKDQKNTESYIIQNFRSKLYEKFDTITLQITDS